MAKSSPVRYKLLPGSLYLRSPVITQCSMRHLYANSKEPGVSFVIDKAKAYGRRRCDHLPEDYPEPLSTKECLASVVDPKGSGTNKHRYVVASQDLDVRKYMRSLKGVPLIYINRSVMIMEPMAEGSTGTREREERDKFRDGLRRTKGDLKRKRTEQEEGPAGQADDHEEVATKKKRRLGPKAPNPLSVKKSKKTPATAQNVAKSTTHGEAGQGLLPPVPGKKRRRGRKLHVEETSGGENRGAETVEEVSA